MTEQFHVIVIGGGTGGMCLAHGLKRAGISVAVYERDRARSDGLYGYRVGIDPDGSRALHRCLSPELYELFVATCARAPQHFNMLDEHIKEILSLRLRDVDDPINSEKSVSWMTLRQVLLTDIEDIIYFDKIFERYETNSDGTVTAYFEDGTSTTSDVLVAADGTGSWVRKQYLPHAKVVPAGIISIAGKVPLTGQTKDLFPPKVFLGISTIAAPKGYFEIIHVMEFKCDHSGAIKLGIGGSDAELIANWPSLLYDNTRDYINWDFAAATKRFSADVMKLRGDELITLVCDMTPNWSLIFHTLLKLTDVGTCFPINIATSEPIPAWPTTNVTLLGDAIHTMIPDRGVGANTALRDAALLTRKLINVRDGKLPLIRAINEYETKMIDYDFQAVLDSRKQQSGDDVVHKPVIGRLALGGMRTTMRVANRLPAVKRKMTDNLNRYRGGGVMMSSSATTNHGPVSAEGKS